MLHEHRIRRPEFRNFIEAAGDEVAGGFGESVGWEVGRCAVDYRLCIEVKLAMYLSTFGVSFFW